MKALWTSTAKMVFLLMTCGVVYFTYIGIIDGKDFISLATMVFGFYFAYKGETGEPHAGK